MIAKQQHTDLMTENYGNVRSIAYEYAILPWGATEPHNYHLPYMTDCYLAHDVAVESAGKAWSKYGVRGMVLPPIPLGSQNPGQRQLPFCIHARYETQRLVLTDIVESLHFQGMRKLVIMNGHGGNNFKSMIRDLTVDYPDMLIANCDWFAVEPRKDYFEEELDDHAGEQETSVMLHYHPELIDLSMAGGGESHPFNLSSLNKKVGWVPRDWSKSSVDTGVGNPRKSTAEKGDRYISVVTDKIALLLYELVCKDLY
ncbi:MAG: creatininase family protein [Bacteroides sp.]|jgi:creatinine amidohydrolase|nr:creatininase family protein [Bacteroides sp.]MCI1682709.1 creatininase family protein [Bacteroides sp.]